MKHFKLLTLSIFMMSFLVMSCGDDESQDIDCMTDEWAYSGDSDPATWSTCNVDCGGQSQSPINITGVTVNPDLAAIMTAYSEAPINIVNNGRTVEFNYASGSTLTIDGVDFELLQFHFHTLSEHTVDGEHFPMETHLVHQDADGNLAVVAIFYEEGDENPFLANFSNNYPQAEGDTFTSADLVNVSDLLPTNMDYYTYGGSLTTPPCSESVTWMLMKNPVQASAAQIDDMSNILQNNFRPVQALNGRSITESN